jgi:hypothetical protein
MHGHSHITWHTVHMAVVTRCFAREIDVEKSASPKSAKPKMTYQPLPMRSGRREIPLLEPCANARTVLFPRCCGAMRCISCVDSRAVALAKLMVVGDVCRVWFCKLDVFT